jgi:hypothetical protein
MQEINIRSPELAINIQQLADIVPLGYFRPLQRMRMQTCSQFWTKPTTRTFLKYVV